MPAKRLPLHQLGDHTKYNGYMDLFDSMYRQEPIYDPLGRRLILPPNACQHLCLKPRMWEPEFVNIADSWLQARAERIGWILEAIRDPDEIRPNHQFTRSDKEAYLLDVVPDISGPAPAEHFYVTVQPEESANSRSLIVFLSAFCVDHKYWREARKGGKALYKRSK